MARGSLVIVMLLGVVGIAVGSLIAAIILRAAAQWVQKLDVPFGKAYGTVFFAGFVNLILGFVVGIVVGTGTRSQEAVNIVAVLMLPVGFLIQSGVMSSQFQIPFGRSCLVSLTMLGISLGISLGIGLIGVYVSAIAKFFM